MLMQLRKWLLFGMVLALGGLVGCAEEVEDVNRSESGLLNLQKTQFDGDWYFRQTVVDVPPTVGLLFDGIESKVEKIRFEIREDQLIAHRVHEAIPGLEQDGTLPGAEFVGSPVASWDIDDHYDIIRDFNRQTGEQTNVITTDMTLRPWYEREYMHVNWSSQRLEGPAVDLEGFLNFISGLLNDHSAVQYVVNNRPEDPGHFQVDDGFFMFTNKWQASYWVTCAISHGNLPWITTNTRNACGTADIKMRNVFVRIDKDDAVQFQPKAYLDRDVLRDDDGAVLRYATVSVPDADGELRMVDVQCNEATMGTLARRGITEADCHTAQWNQFGRFGFFRTFRMVYGRQIGAGNDVEREWYANHHKVWEQVYEIETKGGEPVRDVDGYPVTKKDAAGNPVVIPPADRKVRPVVYHLNTNFPADLMGVAEQIGDDWNAAFSEAIAAAKGISVEELASEMEAETGDPRVYRVEENTCSHKGIDAYLADHPDMREVAEEAAKGTVWESGDLERICSALTWHSRDRDIERFVWQQMGDLRFSFIWWVNEDSPSGPLGYGPSSNDPENGRLLAGNAHVYGAAVDSYARGAADVVAAMNGDLELEGLISGDSYEQWVKRGTTIADEEMELTPEFSAELSRRLGSLNLPGLDRTHGPNGRLDKAAMFRHMERRVVAPSRQDPLARAVGGNGRRDAVIATLKANPDLATRFVPEPVKQLVARFHGAFEDAPEDVRNVAIEMAIDPSVMNRKMRERQQFFSERNVMLPEFMDDSIQGLALELKGLPHEEVYRILREEIFRGVMLHEIGHTVGLTHNFKASADALNFQDEFWSIRASHSPDEYVEKRLPEYRYASIMDYGARFNSDTKGLGKYDHAAIKFVYGGHVAAFDEGVTIPGRLDLEIRTGDYSTIPEMLGGSTNQPDNVHKRHNVNVDEAAEEMRQGIIHNGEVFAGSANATLGDFWVDRVVPFFYCADGYRGDLNCRTWDEGANHQEMVESAIQRYWNYFFFNAYRRGRNEYNFQNSYFSRMTRLSEYMTYPFQYLTFYDAYRDENGAPTALGRDLALAAVKGFNFMIQVIGTPEPGRYCRFGIDDGTPEGYQMWLPQYYANGFEAMRNCTSMTINPGDGRSPYIDLNDDYDAKYEYMGNYYEKIYLSFDIFWDRTRFFRVTDFSDQRRFNVSYYRGFAPEILTLTQDMMFGGIFGPGSKRVYHYRASEDGSELGFPKLIDPARFGGEDAPTDELEVWSRMPYDLMRLNILRAVLFHSHTNDTRVDFIEYLAIDEEGSETDRTYEEGVEISTFTNPKSGASFTAAQTIDGKSLAYELLRNASSYVENRWQPAWDAYQADPSNPTRAAELEQANETIEFYVGLIDEFHDIRQLVDYR